VGTILVTGIAGGLAQLVAQRLMDAGHQVVGVDYRAVGHPLPGGMTVYQANYNKTIIEDVFKHHHFDSVLHLGRVGNLKESAGKRFDLNVVGTQKIMNLCVSSGVKRLVVLSTFHIYGAHPANHIPVIEDEPLRAGLEFPQIADAIQLDNMASTWVYRHPQVCTTVLRPTNVIGPSISNAMSTFLRRANVPHLLGFNPMTQFIHEEDLSSALLTVVERSIPGVFNLTSETVLPWRTALRLARARTYPIPGFMADAYLRVRGGFPQYLINFFRYPCIISDEAFRTAFGWTSRVGIEETIWTTVAEAREQQRLAREKARAR